MSVLFEDVQGDDLERCVLGCFESYRWRHSVVIGLFPAWGTDTPVIAWFETREAEVGHGSAQVIALGLAVIQKSFRHHAADAVLPQVAGIGSAMSISKPTCHRLTTTAFKRTT